MKWIIAILPIMLLCGCRTKYIATEYHTTDTLTVTDTIYLERTVEVSAARMDSNTTNEIKAAKIKITDFDSVGNVSRVTDIDLTSEKQSKSGGIAVESSVATEVEQAGHTEQSGSKTDYKKDEIKVPYVPWWVTAAGIAMILIVTCFFIRFSLRLIKRLKH